ncbi:MCE family protein [Sciscionella marina]|uniref:MCE family protein n=1 Tax=Sciscionella marina TaxID=508770 RepID=UPI00037AA283|nr:MCE family protein [Sciscionella marina]
MIVRNQSGQRLQTRIAMLCALALLLCAGVWWVGSGGTGQVFTAYFGKAVGIYPDSDVRVIGIDVGKVDSVTPQGKQVRVKFSVNRDVPVPANAKAVVVAPTVVSDRYIQLTPSYVEGPRMTSGSVFGRDRTATPVELDQIYANATKLAEALGPEGANKSGALTKVLNSAARNFKGNGAALHDTLHNLAKAANTLSGSKDDLFSTVKHLGDFTKALADNDAQVRDFETRLADVSQFLSDDSGKFGSALSELGDSLVKVKGFIGDNSDLLSKNVDKLIGITKVLVDQRGALAETLDTAPVGISGYLGAYDQASGTVATRGDLGELTFGPVESVCRALTINTPNRSETKDPNKLCDSIANTVDNGLNLPSLAQILSWLWAPKGTPFPTPNKGGGK